jgi:DNA modification methylase
MGTFYRSSHELIFVFKNGTAAHINNFELGQHGRSRSNVLQYRGVNSFQSGRMEELHLHPTVKPVAMIAEAIKDVSARGDIDLDLFGGSGSTLIAAQKTGRRAYLCELDPIYCDRIIARNGSTSRSPARSLGARITTSRVTTSLNCPLPHPDHVVIDMRNGTAAIKGPGPGKSWRSGMSG